jgi:Cytochrome P460
VDGPDVLTQAFVMEKDSKRFPNSGEWGCAVFNYEAASDKFAADPKSLSDCGHAFHTAVKAKDNIFHHPGAIREGWPLPGMPALNALTMISTR